MSYKDIPEWEVYAPERIARFDVQLATRGFDDTDLWSLDLTIAKFALPRLKAFKEGPKSSFPAVMTSEEWDVILDKMIAAFEIMCDGDRWPALNDEDAHTAQIGCELFGQWFTNLWC